MKKKKTKKQKSKNYRNMSVRAGSPAVPVSPCNDQCQESAMKWFI